MNERDGYRLRCLSLVAVVAVVLFGIAGCGGQATVTGKVVLKEDGTPVTKGMIAFEPVDPDMPSGRAYIEPDGSFEAGTKKPGDGLAPGKYLVGVRVPGIPVTTINEDGEEEDDEEERDLIDPKYEDPETSGLEFEVKPGSNEFLIELPKAPDSGSGS